MKARRYRPYGELLALPLPSKPFEQISIDFIIDLPPSADSVTKTAYDAILVIICRYTKVAKYIPTTKTVDAPGLA